MTPAHLTTADLAAWERLVRAAARAARRPEADATELRRAADKAYRTPFPFADKEGRAPFAFLIGLARLWPAQDAATRRMNRGAVLRWAHVCAGALAIDLPPEPPEPPPAPAAAGHARLPYADDSDREEAA